MEKIQEYAYIAVALIMVVEYLIGISKLKSNSSIEMAINIVKFIFGIESQPKKLK